MLLDGMRNSQRITMVEVPMFTTQKLTIKGEIAYENFQKDFGHSPFP